MLQDDVYSFTTFDDFDCSETIFDRDDTLLNNRRLLLPAIIFLFHLNYYLATLYAFAARAWRSLMHC